MVIADRRPQHPAVLFDQPFNVWLSVVGLGLEITAERLLGIGLENGQVDGLLVIDQQRFVVGHEFGEQ